METVVLNVKIEVSKEEFRQMKKNSDEYTIIELAVDDIEGGAFGTDIDEAYKSWLHNLYCLKDVGCYSLEDNRLSILRSAKRYCEWYMEEIYNKDKYVNVSLLFSLYKFIPEKVGFEISVLPIIFKKYMNTPQVKNCLNSLKNTCISTDMGLLKKIALRIESLNGINVINLNPKKFGVNLEEIVRVVRHDGKMSNIKDISVKLGVGQDNLKRYILYRNKFYGDVIYKNGWFKFCK